MSKIKRKLLSAALAMVMVVQTAMPAVFAVESEEAAAKTITGFTALAQIDYTLPLGADEDTISQVLTFPDTITANVEYITTEEVVVDSDENDGEAEQPPAPSEDEGTSEDEQAETPTDSGEPADTEADAPTTTLVQKLVSEQVKLAITWESDRALTTEEAGQFTYTAVLSDSDKGKYDLAEGVSLPQITVYVEAAQPMLLNAVVDAPTVEITEDTKSIYANGTPITVEAGSTDDTTTVWYMNGETKTYVNTNGADGDELYDYCIYGGAKETAVASTSVTMTGGKVDGVCGGGYDGDVTGDTTVSISGIASITNGVCGGSGSSGSVGNNTIVNISGKASIGGDIYGGGFGAVTGSTTVNISGTASINGNIYGGSYGAATGSTTVNISETASVGGAVYGGGDQGEVTGNTTVNISDTASVDESVYGGSAYLATVTGSKNGYVALVGKADADSFTNLLHKTDATSWAVKGDIAVDSTIPTGETLTIPAEATVTVLAGVTLTVDGTLTNNGTVTIAEGGTLNGSGWLQNNGTVNGSHTLKVPPTVETKPTGVTHIYANGTPITIEAGTDEGTSKIKYSDGTNDVYLDLDPTAGVEQTQMDLSKYWIYGSAKDTAVSGTNVTMTGGTVAYVFGGGGFSSSTVNGSTNVEISGGTVANVYGGGRGSGSIGKNTNVTISGGTVANVYGGGSGSVGKNTNVTISGTATITGAVLGGGGSGSTVTGDTNVIISHTATIAEDCIVDGEGFLGTVKGDKNGYVAHVTSDINIDSFDNLLYKHNATNWVSKGSAVIPEGETLTVGSGDTLTLNGTLTATSPSQLVNNGGMLKTTYLTAEDILAISDKAYTGSAIVPEITFINPTILGKVFTLDTKGYTPSYANNTNVGKATITFTKGGYTVNKDFNIVQSATEFTGGVKAYNGITATNTFTYGDTITVKVTPTATGTAPKAGLRTLTAPAANQMALFVGETQITDAKSVTNGTEVSFTIDTADKQLAIGSNTITAKYVGNANMANTEGSVTVTLNKKAITSATVTSGATKVYDETNSFTNVGLTLKPSDILGTDNVTATANGTADNADVGTAKTFTATATTLGGAQGGYYSLASGAVGGTVEITQATPTYAVANQSIKIGKGISAISKKDTATGVNNTSVAGTLTWSETDGGTALDETYGFSGAVGNTITLFWSFAPTSGNYQEIKGSTVFTLTDKDVPVLSVENISKTYDGTAVTTVSGTASVDNQPVAGTFSFAADTAEMKNVGVYTATVEFTPNNTADYTTASTAITVTITKATPSGTPSVDNITSSGKTLADATIAVGTITPDGNIAWDLVDSTEVTQGTEYAWTFTPTDSGNYNNLTGKVTLWANSTDGGGSTGGGSSSGGGSGGSSSGGNIIVTTPPATTENPKPATVATTTVKPTVSNGTATVTVPESVVNNAIAKAQAEAKKNGRTENGINITIKTDTGNATSLTANLPKASIDALVKAGVKETSIQSGVITIILNLDALKEIQKQAGTDVTVTATKVANSTLSAQAKAVIGNRPVYDLSITAKNGAKITSLGKGKVSVSIPYTLGADEKAGNVIAYYIDSNGKVQEMPNSAYDTQAKTLSFVTDHFSLYGVGYKANETTAFTDITNHWAKESIEFVAARGLLAGTGNNKFSPDTSMTRGMFVTALGRLAGADVSSYKTSSFTDVKAGSYYLGYIEWASKNGIVNGTGNGKFAPDQSISREQMAVIMQSYAKAIGFELPKAHAEILFADHGKISSYATDAVKTMQMAGILAGKNGNKFDPQGTATRAEVSAVLKRFVELVISTDNAQGWMQNDSGKWMFFENGRPVTGTKTIDGTSYTFDANGETADMPKNLTYGTYTVQKGDSFWSIAWKYKCNLFELARVNDKSIFSIIYPGDELKVPSK